MLLFDYSDWPAVVRSLHRERMKWERFSILLGQEGAGIIISGSFYMAVVQYILLFGLEVWVITPRILRVLGRLHKMGSRSRCPLFLRALSFKGTTKWAHKFLNQFLNNF